MLYPATFELPTTDKLTGLTTSPYFLHLLREQLLPQAEGSGDPLTLGFVDIDNFLGVNTRLGHACGDEVLRQAARTLHGILPESGVAARYGGDEFAFALPDTRLDDAFTLAEEFRRQVAGLRLAEWPDLALTCSIGLAAFPSNGHREPELIREADQALYVAKAGGRNKVALPLADSRMITKTSYYTTTQLERLAQLARDVKRNEASLLREALDNLLKKYNDRLHPPPPRLAPGA